ncbi:MAG: hypothetical protein LUF81_07695 [Clostridiales bacterium]|nr:hypothetical protein [Clostridiales bacterium]
MKKHYSSPYLIVETFQVDTGIASCSGDGGYALGRSSASCYADENAAFDFFADGACTVDIENTDDDLNNKICYHGPLGTGVTFIYS